MKEVIGQNPLEPEQLELDQLLSEHSESVASPRKKRSIGWRHGIAATAAALALAACGQGGTPTTPVVNGEGNAPLIGGDTSGKLNLLFPFQDTWYLTGGPHSDGLSGNVKYALDFAPTAVLPCPGSGPLATEIVTASESGKVIVAGNPNDTADPNHSIVEIEDPEGFDVGYMHLDGIKVKVGQEVSTGDPLGNPSCETPPGGETTGIHVHEFLERNGQPLPITDAVFDGLAVNAESNNYQGTLSGDGKVITADVGRWTQQNSGPEGIVNEVSNSGASETQITSTGTQTPVENPTATPEAVNQNPKDIAKNAFLKKWLSLFSGQPVESHTKYPPTGGDQYNYVSMQILNMPEWQHNLATLQAGGTSDSPLLVDYRLVQATPDAVLVVFGQWQVTKISLTVGESELSYLQKTQGVEFNDMVQMDASIAYRENYLNQGLGYGADLKGVQKWATTVQSPLPSAFSDPVESGMGIIEFAGKDGQLTETDISLPLFGKIPLPTDFMLSLKDQNCEQGYNVAPCQLLPDATLQP